MAEQKEKKKTPDKNEIASIKGDDIFFQFIGKMLINPDAILSKESRGKGIKIYDELLRDPHIFSQMQTRALSVTSRDYEVTPSSDKRQDVKIAEFVKNVLDGFTYDSACEDILTGMVKGFSVGEVMWEMSEGDVWIKAIKHRSQRRFVFSVDEELRLLTPQALIEGIEIPERKFQVITWGAEAETAYGNPLGNKLYWPWWFKKHGIKWWVVFQEKFAQPTPWGKYPPGTNKDDQTKLLNAIEAIQTDSGIITPDNMLIEFLEATRTGRDNYKSFPDFMNAEMSKAILGQTLTAEQGDKGARSLGEVHERVKEGIVEADCRTLCASQNAQMIRWLVDYNFPGVKKYPRVVRRMKEDKDLKAAVEIDKALVVDIGLPVSKQYLYDTYGIPQPKDKEEVLQPLTVNRQPSTEGKQEFAEPGTKAIIEEQRAVDKLEDSLTPEQLQEQMEGVLKPILNLIENGSSYDEIRENLIETFPDMDTGSIEDMLARAIFVSETWGRLNAVHS